MRHGTGCPSCWSFPAREPEWIILGFAAGSLAGTLALATHTEFGLPLELFEFHGGPKGEN